MTFSSDQALLLACLHTDAGRLAACDLPDVVSPRWDVLVAMAARQRVRPLLARRVKALAADRRAPAHIVAHLEQTTQSTTLRNLRFQAETAAVARALAPQGVDVLLLKGGHLIAGLYDQIGLREMSDIDLLVRREHLPAAVEVIAGRGYEPIREFSIALDTAFHHHLTRFVRRDVGIELHWTLTVPTMPHTIDPLPLWRRARPLVVGGARVFGLSLEDLLLHLCYHASYQHQFRFGLRPFCDVAMLAARRDPAIDWDAVSARAREWTWDRGVSLTLRLARDLIGAAVPTQVLDALTPQGPADTVLASACAQVFDEGGPAGLEPGVARLASDESITTRLRHLGQRLAPPPRELARLYGQSPTSPSLALTYARRAWDLAIRHTRPAVRLLVSRDVRLTDSAARTDLLRRWLA